MRDQHWDASDANDLETEHAIYHADAVLKYPQSGERIRGRRNTQIMRTEQPSRSALSSSESWVMVIFGSLNPF